MKKCLFLIFGLGLAIVSNLQSQRSQGHKPIPGYAGAFSDDLLNPNASLKEVINRVNQLIIEVKYGKKAVSSTSQPGPGQIPSVPHSNNPE